MSKDKMIFISASSDNTAKLFDTISFELLKTYRSGEPVNSAFISPLKDHIVLGGGTSSSLVTTTAARNAYFEARFFHMVFEEEIGTVKGHFGPIHALAFSPDGKSFVSGGEDGFVSFFFLN
jgi:translation initiation factor 3 subunit I